MYVIIRGDEYVCPPGQEKSYTKKLQEAMCWEDRSKAKVECCENERVVSVREILNPR